MAHRYYGLAELCRAQGNDPQAKGFYEKALTIWQERLGHEHSLIAHPLYGLAELCRTQRNYPQAKEHCKRALMIWQKQLGPEHPQTTFLLNRLAKIYQEQRNCDQAERCYNEVNDSEKHSQPRFSDGGSSKYEACSPPLRCVVNTPLRRNSSIPS
jgi:tetratricopeptide (TPR) repeat protein